jgi:Uma2 family endonuclease
MTYVTFESTETVTQEEFARFCAEREGLGDIYHYELLNGRIVMNPPAGYPHGDSEARVVRLLANHVSAHRLGHMVGSSQGFELPSGDTVEPDASFVSTERWQEAPAPEEGKFLRVVPDLVVEIPSRRTTSYDRGEKKAIYERNCVREYWIVDTRARSLTVYLLRDGRFDAGHVYTTDDRCVSEVLAGLELAVGELFPSGSARAAQ